MTDSTELRTASFSGFTFMPLFQRRELNFKINIVKRFITFKFQPGAESMGAFNMGFDTVNVHRPTLYIRANSCVWKAVRSAMAA
jgi:hypothetical protein